MPTTIFKTTDAYVAIRRAWASHRTVIAYGGSSSSKSISVLQLLSLYAFKYPNRRITLSAESLPVIKKTIFADWRAIVMGDAYQEARFNKSEMVYSFPNGSIFQFVPADDEARWHGMRQHVAYFDELYHIKKAIWDQADIRTSEHMIASFNPVSEFWAREVMDMPTTAVLHSTYKDNKFLEPSIIEALEARAGRDKNFYDVYVLGKFGSLEGLIFKEGEHWEIIKELPEEYDRRVICGDFGYSNDPCAILELRLSDGVVYANEITYQTGLLNSDIAEILRPLECRAVFDSAEPKSIDEIRMQGLPVYPSQKGKDSINSGINLIKQHPLRVTNNSLGLIKELRNYSWAKDRRGEQLSKPIDDFNHSIDALRYGMFDFFNMREVFFI